MKKLRYYCLGAIIVGILALTSCGDKEYLISPLNYGVNLELSEDNLKPFSSNDELYPLSATLYQLLYTVIRNEYTESGYSASSINVAIAGRNGELQLDYKIDSSSKLVPHGCLNQDGFAFYTSEEIPNSDELRYEIFAGRRCCL